MGMDAASVIRMLAIVAVIALSIAANSVVVHRVRKSGYQLSLSLLFAIVTGVAVYCAAFIALWHSLRPKK
jgi:hypothetical protein